MNAAVPRSGSMLIWRYLLVALLILPATILRVGLAMGDHNIPVLIDEASLPDTVGESVGHSVPLTAEELSMLQSPASSQKVYENAKTHESVQVMLLQVNNTQNAHDPRICMSGSGFDLTHLDVIDADWVGNSGVSHRISRAVFAKDGLEITMYYWIQTPTGTIWDMSAGLKWAGVLRALHGQSTKGIAVRLICLPKRDGREPTDPAAAERFWRRLNQKLDIERLVAGM